jgi:hypothetical protein
VRSERTSRRLAEVVEVVVSEALVAEVVVVEAASSSKFLRALYIIKK